MSTPSNQPISSNASSDGKGDPSTESTTQLRHDIAQMRNSMSSTLSEIGYKLTPQHLTAQAKDALPTNAQQIADDAAQRARILAADAQAQANTLALALREQAEHRRQQLRRWLDDMTAHYPWIPAAVLGGVLVVSALALWRLNARNERNALAAARRAGA